MEPAKDLTKLLTEMSAHQFANWLRRALKEEISLPRLTSDEPSDIALHRLAMELPGHSRATMTTAIGALVQEWLNRPEETDEYLASLLGLVRRLKLSELLLPISAFARSPSFSKLTYSQRGTLLRTMLDMGQIETPPRFWEEVAKNGQHLSLALTGILRSGVLSLDVLLNAPVDGGPETKREVNGVFIVLSRYARELGAGARAVLTTNARAILPRLSTAFKETVEEWLVHQEPATPQQAKLGANLTKFFEQRQEEFTRKGVPAKLLPEHQTSV